MSSQSIRLPLFSAKILDRETDGRLRLLPANSTDIYSLIEITENRQFEIFVVVIEAFRRFK